MASPSAKQGNLRRRGGAPAALACAMALFAGGCIGLPFHRHRRPPMPDWSLVTVPRPRIVEPPAPDPVEELVLAAPLGPFLPIELPGPPRPHLLPPPPEPPVRTPAIVPQLSTQESALAQRETRQYLSASERILNRTRERALSPEQADLVAKVRGFIRDARAAARESDWMRARSLAEKAYLLAQELARTF